jgi:hypothetical protein
MRAIPSIASRDVADPWKRRARKLPPGVSRQISIACDRCTEALQDVLFLLSVSCGDRGAAVGEQDALELCLMCRRLFCGFRSSGQPTSPTETRSRPHCSVHRFGPDRSRARFAVFLLCPSCQQVGSVVDVAHEILSGDFFFCRVDRRSEKGKGLLPSNHQ